MSGVGGMNPYPRAIGGAPSMAETVYLALRSAMGVTKGRAVGKPFWQGNVEDAWRWCRALGIARVLMQMEQAAIEFFPNLASYTTPRWEDSLALLPAGTLNGRRRQVTDRWVQPLDVAIPRLTEALQARFGPTVTISLDSDTNRNEAHLHRWLSDRTGAVPFGPRRSSVLAGYSSASIIKVVWPGLHSEAELQPMRDMLNSALPSHIDWRIINGTGFKLGGGVDGTSKLGRKGLGW